MNQPPANATTGERVAYYRRRAGLTQQQLSEVVGRYPGWTGKIESGKWELDRLPILEKIAQALGVTVADLKPAVTMTHDHEPTARTQTNRADTTPLLVALATYPELDLPPAPEHAKDLPDRLRHQVEQLAPPPAHGDEQRVIDTLAQALPELDLGAAQAADTTARIPWQRAASVAYQAAADLLTHLGEPAAAWLAADRAIKAAINCGDRRRAASAALHAAATLLAQRRVAEARTTAHAIIRTLEDVAGDPNADPADLALAGTAHLYLARTYASEGRADDARQELRLAQRVADQVGEDGDWEGTPYGPGTVVVASVDVAISLGEPGAALDIADRTETTNLPVECRARILLHTARAHILRREAAPALKALLEAEALAPDVIRHDPDSVGAVRDLGTLSKRVRGKDLANLRDRLEANPKAFAGG